jgi:hypothetical protein
MGRTILLDTKPLSNLLNRLALGRFLDRDQEYYPSTYDSLARLLLEPATHVLSTHAVATEALYHLLAEGADRAKMDAVHRTPIKLLSGDESDLNEFGRQALPGTDFADFTLIRAWESLAQSGVRPYPITVTTDRPFQTLATGRFNQNAYTVEDVESNPELL